MRMEEQVGRVNQRVGLFGDGARERRMRVPERGDADAGQQVEVFAAPDIVQPHALAPDERDRIAPIRLQHVP